MAVRRTPWVDLERNEEPGARPPSRVNVMTGTPAFCALLLRSRGKLRGPTGSPNRVED